MYIDYLYLLTVVKTLVLSKKINKTLRSPAAVVKDPSTAGHGDATKILYLYANVIYMTLNISWLVTHDSTPFF